MLSTFEPCGRLLSLLISLRGVGRRWTWREEWLLRSCQRSGTTARALTGKAVDVRGRLGPLWLQDWSGPQKPLGWRVAASGPLKLLPTFRSGDKGGPRTARVLGGQPS